MNGDQALMPGKVSEVDSDRDKPSIDGVQESQYLAARRLGSHRERRCESLGQQRLGVSVRANLI